MATCAYCGKLMGEVAAKGENGLYCSAECLETAETGIVKRRLNTMTYWVCIMVDRRGGHRGGYFTVGSWDKPEGVIQGDHVNIAADSYEVVYGPCSGAEAEEFLHDVEA